MLLWGSLFFKHEKPNAYWFLCTLYILKVLMSFWNQKRQVFGITQAHIPLPLKNKLRVLVSKTFQFDLAFSFGFSLKIFHLKAIYAVLNVILQCKKLHVSPYFVSKRDRLIIHRYHGGGIRKFVGGGGFRGKNCFCFPGDFSGILQREFN